MTKLLSPENNNFRTDYGVTQINCQASNIDADPQSDREKLHGQNRFWQNGLAKQFAAARGNDR